MTRCKRISAAACRKLVSRHGKAVIGWDEVLVEGVPKDIVIQSWVDKQRWRNRQTGLPGILSNGYYLDLGGRREALRRGPHERRRGKSFRGREATDSWW